MKSLIVSFTLILASSAAFAGPKMTSETHTVVIEKLEKALASVREDETVSMKPIRARLADLYADRARLKAIEEVEQNCQNCKGSKEDRTRAIELLDVVVREADKGSQGSLMLQLAHLHQIQGEPAKAENVFERMIQTAERHEDTLLAKAYVGRAERRFGRNEFAKAQSDFEIAYRKAAPTRKGPILHRISWTELNQGRQPKAVATILRVLRNPDLMMRESTNGEVLDVSFQEDLVNDLASFLARGPVGAREIEMVEHHASSRNKRDALKHLASECERLGNKKAALTAWDAVLRLESGDQDRLETTVRVAQIRFDLGHKDAALLDLREAVALWKKRGCSDEQICPMLKLRLRNLVADWNRGEKKKPTEQLLAAYRAYLVGFPDDMQMTHWAALVARGLKKPSEAAVLYHKASLLAVNSQDKEAKNILESSLVGEIEMAELAKDPKARESAYLHYLNLAPSGSMAHKVRYQHAHLAYEQGQTREAISRLSTFAMSPECRASNGGAQKLCIQAADLDLDSRVQSKDDVSVERAGLEYAKIYPSRKMEYLKIARTAALKQAESMASNGDPEKGVEKLAGIDMAGADKDERLKVLKIRLALAERAQDLAAVKSAAGAILATKGLSDSDQELALGKQAWAHEMMLEFDPAYRVSLKLDMPKLSKAERELRLALLAELAGRSPRGHEEAYLRLVRSARERAIVRAKQVRSSRNPGREFRAFEGEISRIPGLYAPVALEVFARTGDQRIAERALKSAAVRKDPAGRAMARQLFLAEFTKFDRKIFSHRLRSESDYLVQKSLADRVALLNQADSAANHAIAMGDWTSQLVTLTVVSRENKRLHREVLALPAPAKLRQKEREQYKQLVASKAQQFAQKASAIDGKLSGFWSDDAAFDDLAEQHAKATRPELRSILAREMKWIASVAPDKRRYQIEKDLKERAEVPSTEKIAGAMRDVREAPFSERPARRLRDLEADRGNDTMVTYLDARISKIKTIKLAQRDSK